MTWIKREIESTIMDLAAKRPSLVISGPRQTGKTALCQRCFPKANYVSLDLPLLAQEAEESGEPFLERHGTPLVIDEVQHAPGIFPYVKNSIDQHRDKNGQYIITGSQSFTLMQGVSESLSGRTAILTVQTLSAREYEHFTGKTLKGNDLAQWLLAGGYPELHAKKLDIAKFYADYVATYLERDIRQIIQVRNLRDFDRFLRLCAVRTGQLLSYSSLASDVGVSVNTIKSWVSTLEASNVIYLLEPYFENLGKRLVKTPKLYFLDTGLATYLAGIRSQEELLNSPMLGALFETHALGQILRTGWNRGVPVEIFFYRDASGTEVDFVIPSGGKLRLFECKWSSRPSERIKGFEELCRRTSSEKIIEKTIIYAGRENITSPSGIRLANSIDPPI